MSSPFSGNTFKQNVDFICVGMVYALVMVPHFIKVAVLARIAKSKGDSIDNSDPRATAAKLLDEPSDEHAEDLRLVSRMASAHANGWESLILFGVCLLMARSSMMASDERASAAIAFVVFRTLYVIAFYVIGRPSMGWIRSLLWASGVGCCLYLLGKAGSSMANL